jgi:hypothetical protein
MIQKWGNASVGSKFLGRVSVIALFENRKELILYGIPAKRQNVKIHRKPRLTTIQQMVFWLLKTMF